MWVAAVPAGQAQNAAEIKVILRSTRCQSEAEIPEKFALRDCYRGAVINPTMLMTHDPYRPLLQEAFPHLKLASTIWEVDIDYAKPSEKWATGFYIAAVALAFIGFLCGTAWCVLPGSSALKGDQQVRAVLEYSVRE